MMIVKKGNQRTYTKAKKTKHSAKSIEQIKDRLNKHQDSTRR